METFYKRGIWIAFIFFSLYMIMAAFVLMGPLILGLKEIGFLAIWERSHTALVVGTAWCFLLGFIAFFAIQAMYKQIKEKMME